MPLIKGKQLADDTIFAVKAQADGTPAGLNLGSSSSGGTYDGSTGLSAVDHSHALSVEATIADVGITASAGSGNNIARGDHVHAHGNFTAGGTTEAMHGLATPSGGTNFNGFMSAEDKQKVDNLFNAAGDLTLPLISTPTYDSLEDLNTLLNTAGMTTGGAITDAGGGSIDVAAGTGLIRISNSETADLSFFDWAASNGNAIPSDTIRYIGVEYNAGSPQVSIRTTENWNYNDDFPLGTVVNEGGTLHIEESSQMVGDAVGNLILRLYQTDNIARDDYNGGLVLGETGTRNVTVSAGALWKRLERYAISAIDTSGADDWDEYYNPGGGWTKVAAVSQYNNTQYDKSGTLTALSTDFYTNRWFYIELEGDLVMVYGTAQYATIGGAEGEAPPSTLPDRLQTHGTLLGRFIVQEGEATAAAIESAFTTTFNAAVVTDHGDLSGLGDNDHPQYPLAPTSGQNLFNDAEGDPADVDVAVSASDGTSNYAARRDHTHVADVETVAGNLGEVGTTAAVGTSTTLVRADHVHVISTTAKADVLDSKRFAFGIATTNTVGSATGTSDSSQAITKKIIDASPSKEIGGDDSNSGIVTDGPTNNKCFLRDSNNNDAIETVDNEEVYARVTAASTATAANCTWNGTTTVTCTNTTGVTVGDFIRLDSDGRLFEVTTVNANVSFIIVDTGSVGIPTSSGAEASSKVDLTLTYYFEDNDDDSEESYTFTSTDLDVIHPESLGINEAPFGSLLTGVAYSEYPADHTHSAYLTNALADATGDIIVASANDTWARLGIGSPGQVLTVSGSTAVWANSVSSDTEYQEAITTQVITGADTALTDTLANAPKTDSLNLFLNGVHQEAGAGNDYTLSGQTITWLASSGTAVDMEADDVLIAAYVG